MPKKYTVVKTTGTDIWDLTNPHPTNYNPQNGIVWNDGSLTKSWVGYITGDSEPAITDLSGSISFVLDPGSTAATQCPIMHKSSARSKCVAVWAEDSCIRLVETADTLANLTEVAGLKIADTNVRLVGLHDQGSLLYLHYITIDASNTYYWIKSVTASGTSWTAVFNIEIGHRTMENPTAALGFTLNSTTYLGLVQNIAGKLSTIQLISGSASIVSYSTLYELYYPQYRPFGQLFVAQLISDSTRYVLDYNLLLDPLPYDMQYLGQDQIRAQAALGYPYALCHVIHSPNEWDGIIDGYTKNLYLIQSADIGSNPIAIVGNIYAESAIGNPYYTLTKTRFNCVKGTVTQGVFEITFKDDSITYFNGQSLFLFSNDNVLVCRYWIESIARIRNMLMINGHNLNNEMATGYPVFCNTPLSPGNSLKAGVEQSRNLYTITGDIQSSGALSYLDGAEISLSQLANTAEAFYAMKVYVTPEGRVLQPASPTDSGITLSTANRNCTFTDEFEFTSNFGTIILYGGFINGAKLESIAVSDLYDSSLIYSAEYPWVIDQTVLDAMAATIKAQQVAQITEFTPIYKGAPLQYGTSVTVDLTNLADFLPVIGASSLTMYCDSNVYDLHTGLQYPVFVSGFLYRRELAANPVLLEFSALIGQSVDNLATDAQLNGNIYLPYFQATNYNPATSSWVYQSCADNTVTPLNLYNIVQNEGGWSWTSINRTKVYVPTAGWYLFQARVQFEGNSSGTRQARLRIDGVNADSHMLAAFLTQGSVDTIVNATGMGYVGAGSYVELCGLQDTSPGVSLNMKYMAFNIVRLSR